MNPTQSELIDAMHAALVEYADHQSWRCDHAPHFYLADEAASRAITERDDCYCGLKKTLRDLGIEIDTDD